MSFDWREYSSLADELGGVPSAPPPASEEAKLRAAISRFYYSVFCRARNFLRDVDGDRGIPRGGECHEYVQRAFFRSNDRTRKAVGTKLDRLRKTRNRVDYDDVLSFNLSVTFTKTKREAGDCSRKLEFLARPAEDDSHGPTAP
jgi:uncharacterized protein (UPF0332 family)